MLHVDTTGIALSNQEEVYYRRLFEHILFIAKVQGLRGNLSIPFDGAGHFGDLKQESFVSVTSPPAASPSLAKSPRK